MKRGIIFLALAFLLTACTITIQGYPLYEPVPNVYYRVAYEGRIQYDYGAESRLTLNFESMTYSLDGFVGAMYQTQDGRVITLGDSGGYKLHVVNRTYSHISGNVSYSSMSSYSGTFDVHR